MTAAERARAYRARKKAEAAAVAAGNVTSIASARADREAPEDGELVGAVRDALQSLDEGAPLGRIQLAAAIALAREIEHPRGAASTGPLVQQLNTLVKEALGSGGGGGGGSAAGGLASILGSRG
jgi:hypothetical protein